MGGGRHFLPPPKKKSEWDPTFTKLYEMPSHFPHKSSYGIALCYFVFITKIQTFLHGKIN